jgi:hypothetical protein
MENKKQSLLRLCSTTHSTQDDEFQAISVGLEWRFPPRIRFFAGKEGQVTHATRRCNIAAYATSHDTHEHTYDPLHESPKVPYRIVSSFGLFEKMKSELAADADMGGKRWAGWKQKSHLHDLFYLLFESFCLQYPMLTNVLSPTFHVPTRITRLVNGINTGWR